MPRDQRDLYSYVQGAAKKLSADYLPVAILTAGLMCTATYSGFFVRRISILVHKGTVCGRLTSHTYRTYLVNLLYGVDAED